MDAQKDVPEQITFQPDSMTATIPPPEKIEEEKEKEANKWMNPLLVTLAIITGIVVIVLFSLLLFGKKNKQNQTPQIINQVITPTPEPQASIKGTIVFQGYAPTGSYIAIAERVQGKTDFKDVVSGLIPGKDTSWDWKDATHGTNYEIVAELKVSGKTIQESPISVVSAPAMGVELPIVSEQKPPQPQTGTISGNIHLDGYIPSGSTLIVLSRITGSGSFATTISGLPAQGSVPFSWTSAAVGKTYDIAVQLQNSSGTPISANVFKTITAPSSGLSFSVSSTAQPPAPTVTGISGTILLNGDIPANSYITIGTRPSGTSSFNQLGSNISATNGVTWSWNNAQSGAQYDIQAYLWVNGAPYAQSSISTITAPSQNNQLTINAQQQLSAPGSNTLSVACNGQQNGQFQTTINYNTNASIQNAQQYNIIVTQAAQGNQVMNTTLTPTNPNQAQSLTTGYQFTSNTTYYAQYAYSTSSTPNKFSSLSPAVQFSCQ